MRRQTRASGRRGYCVTSCVSCVGCFELFRVALNCVSCNDSPVAINQSINHSDCCGVGLSEAHKLGARAPVGADNGHGVNSIHFQHVRVDRVLETDESRHQRTPDSWK